MAHRIRIIAQLENIENGEIIEEQVVQQMVCEGEIEYKGHQLPCYVVHKK